MSLFLNSKMTIKLRFSLQFTKFTMSPLYPLTLYIDWIVGYTKMFMLQIKQKYDHICKFRYNSYMYPLSEHCNILFYDLHISWSESSFSFKAKLKQTKNTKKKFYCVTVNAIKRFYCIKDQNWFKFSFIKIKKGALRKCLLLLGMTLSTDDFSPVTFMNVIKFCIINNKMVDVIKE